VKGLKLTSGTDLEEIISFLKNNNSHFEVEEIKIKGYELSAIVNTNKSGYLSLIEAYEPHQRRILTGKNHTGRYHLALYTATYKVPENGVNVFGVYVPIKETINGRWVVRGQFK